MLRDIGEGVDILLDHELTPAAARIQVMINGLEPLVKETIVEFDDGSEALLTIEYKRLKSHCSHCHRLTHAKKDCPGLQNIRETSKERSPPHHKQDRSTNTGSHSIQKRRSRDPERSHYHPYQRPARSNLDRSSASRAPRDYGSRLQPLPPTRSTENKLASQNRGSPRNHDYYKGDSNRVQRTTTQVSEIPARHAPVHSLQWREKTPVRENNLVETSQSSRSRRPPLERTMPANPIAALPPLIPTIEAVMEDLCDVTIQYTSCLDPTENAARVQRVILGETKDMMARTAASIIESAKQAYMIPAALAESQTLMPDTLSQDLPVHPAQLQQSAPAPPKKKKGRPPTTKLVSKSPIRLVGAKSSKRQLCNIQSSPKRKQGEETVSTSSRSSTQRRQAAQVTSNMASTSRAPPQRKIIPAIVKGRVDFHNPPPPLP